LGDDFHERLVEFCHDARGIALSGLYATSSSIISTWWRCALVACFEMASGLIRSLPEFDTSCFDLAALIEFPPSFDVMAYVRRCRMVFIPTAARVSSLTSQKCEVKKN
jgi:hypothetical protein